MSRAAFDQFAKRWTYKCDGCGQLDHWSPSWIWYGSMLDADNGDEVHACSAQCMPEARRKYTASPLGVRR